MATTPWKAVSTNGKSIVLSVFTHTPPPHPGANSEQ
jgi:hypothetical protein